MDFYTMVVAVTGTLCVFGIPLLSIWSWHRRKPLTSATTLSAFATVAGSPGTKMRTLRDVSLTTRLAFVT